jgi:hypothetical protein
MYNEQVKPGRSYPSLILLAVSVFFLASATPVPPVQKRPVLSLRAHHHQKTLWQVDVSGTAQSCTATLGKNSRPLAADECQAAFAALPWITAHASPTKKPSFSIDLVDEPSYEFAVADRHLAVDFVAPRECEAGPGGELKCTDHTLSPAGDLLLLLRAHALALLKLR